MTIYEKLDEHGVVIERVQPIDGDHTDTLLGCLVLDGNPHWRIAPAPDEQLVVDEPDDNAADPVPAAADLVEDTDDQAAVASTPTPKATPKPAGKRATPKE